MTRQLGHARLQALDPGGHPAQPLPALRFEPVGFAAADRLWPTADNAFGGYQLLLEYFASARNSCSSICAAWTPRCCPPGHGLLR